MGDPLGRAAIKQGGYKMGGKKIVLTSFEKRGEIKIASSKRVERQKGKHLFQPALQNYIQGEMMNGSKIGFITGISHNKRGLKSR